MTLQKTSGSTLKFTNATNRLTTVLFIIYLIALCWILLFKLGVQFSYMDNRRVNLIPFGKHFTLNAEVILNVLIFVPLGVYTGILFKKWHLGRKLSSIFFASLIVEGLQYLLAIGAFDITDIITNTLGGTIGLLIYKVIEKVFGASAKAQKFINLIAAFGTTVVIIFLLLLKLDMLPIRYK